MSQTYRDGDRCVKKVAQAISTAARRSVDLLVPYGGEEFALTLTSLLGR